MAYFPYDISALRAMLHANFTDPAPENGTPTLFTLDMAQAYIETAVAEALDGVRKLPIE